MLHFIWLWAETCQSKCINHRHTRPSPTNHRHTRPSPTNNRHTRPSPTNNRQTRPSPTNDRHTRPSPTNNNAIGWCCILLNRVAEMQNGETKSVSTWTKWKHKSSWSPKHTLAEHTQLEWSASEWCHKLCTPVCGGRAGGGGGAQMVLLIAFV